MFPTFFKVFPEGILWSNDEDGEGYDAVLFGQVGPTQFDLDQLGARLDRDDHALVKASLREVGFLSVVDLLGTYAGQATDLQDWVRDAQLNRDRNLRLQYLAGMGYNSFVESEILSEIMQHYEFPDRLIRGSEALKEALKARRPGRGANLAAPGRMGTLVGTAAAKEAPPTP